MNLKPGVPKFLLHFLSGLMWTGVGIFLISLTREWIAPVQVGYVVEIIIVGVILGGGIYTFGFSKLARKNISRIEDISSEKPCLFAFQKWSSYPLIAFMISLGIFLRVYSPIPKTWLAVLYIGLGLGLFLSSVHYYKHIWDTSHGNQIRV